MTKVLHLLFYLSMAASAQSIGIGVKGGVPLTEMFASTAKAAGGDLGKVKNFAIGPMFELRLPFSLGLELDALYKRFETAGQGGSSWELPILGKYRFGKGSAHPYLEAGVSFHRFSDLAKFLGGGAGILGGASIDSRRGFVMGGGVEAKILLLRVSPGFRFTRWGEATAGPAGSAQFGLAGSNQADFLVGITF